jgi:hypothetical protein
VLFPDTAHLCAQVHCLKVHGDTVRLDHLCERVGDLFAQALLNGEAPREQSHQPGQL